MASSKSQIQQRRQKKKQQKQLTLLLVGGALLLIAGTIFGINAWNNQPNSGLVTVTGQPSLAVDQELIDFGDVKLDSTRTFSIHLTNIGDENLVFSQTPYVEVKEGC